MSSRFPSLPAAGAHGPLAVRDAAVLPPASVIAHAYTDLAIGIRELAASVGAGRPDRHACSEDRIGSGVVSTPITISWVVATFLTALAQGTVSVGALALVLAVI